MQTGKGHLALRRREECSDVPSVRRVNFRTGVAWTLFPKRPKDHTFNQVLNGEIAVSELRPEDRTEALTVQMQSRDGASRMWLNPIMRTNLGIALADAIDWQEPTGGRFSGLFSGQGVGGA